MDVEIEWQHGCPVISGELAWFLCREWAAYDGGDHTIFVAVPGLDYHGGLPADRGRPRRHYGKSSSRQSWKYRELAFLRGIKAPELAEPVSAMPGEHAELLATLEAPSVYDETLALLHRRGLAIPEDVVRRDTLAQHQARREIARLE
jgi:hypothetical protein